jgi:hypothetical protein
MFTTGLIGEMVIKREMEQTSSYSVTETLRPGARPFEVVEVQLEGKKV